MKKSVFFPGIGMIAISGVLYTFERFLTILLFATGFSQPKMRCSKVDFQGKAIAEDSLGQRKYPIAITAHWGKTHTFIKDQLRCFQSTIPEEQD